MASYADTVRGEAGSRTLPAFNRDRTTAEALRPRERRETPAASYQATNATRTVEEVFESQEGIAALPHPTKAQAGEQLPNGYSRSYAGLLLKDLKREIQVNTDIVKSEMDFLQTFAVIAFFIGGRPPEIQMQGWLGKL